MLVKTLNTGVDLHMGDNDNDISNYSDADDSVANNHSQREVVQSQQRDDEMKTKTKSYDSLQQQQKLQQQQQQQRSSNIGYCRLGKELARDFNKTVLLWPCPHIKVSNTTALIRF
uniref:Uncharacterized protein n=1 Tax=Glossina pallidipes TaxID=7398 RepID=A0A1A9ZA99_GLOPL